MEARQVHANLQVCVGVVSGDLFHIFCVLYVNAWAVYY